MLLNETQRKKFLEICLRRASPNPSPAAEQQLQATSAYTLPKLNILTPYLVCGAWAVNNYAVPRYTPEVDLLVRPEDLENIVTELTLRGYTIVDSWSLSERRDKDFYGCRLESTRESTLTLDILTTTADWLEEAFAEAEQDPNGNPVLSLSYLVLTKINGRPRDLADLVATFKRISGRTLTRAKDVLLQHNPRAVDELAKLVLLAKIESGN